MGNQQLCLRRQVILAADTVYDEQLTEALMQCASRLLRPCNKCGDAAAAPAGVLRILFARSLSLMPSTRERLVH